MKILVANYKEGEVLFVVEGFPKSTFCVSLKDKTTQKEVTDELKVRVAQEGADTEQDTFTSLNIKNLVGTNI